MYRLYLTPSERRKEEERKKRESILKDRPKSFPYSDPMMDPYFKALEEKQLKK